MKITKLLLPVVLLTLTFILATPKPAQAINYTGPDEADSTAADLRFEVARRCAPYPAVPIGCGGALEAPESTVVVYLRASSGTITIVNGNQDCAGDSYNAPTTFYFYRGEDPIGAYAHAPIADSAMNCGSYGVAVTGLPARPIGTTTFYPVTVRALHGSAQGINSFEINGPTNSIVSYYNGSGDFFTIQEKGSNPPALSTFNIKFGPDCDVTAPTVVPLRWWDDDHKDAPGASPHYGQDANDGFRMEVWEQPFSPAGTGTRTRIANLEYNGSNSGFVDPPQYAGTARLSNNNYGWVGDHKAGWAGIRVRPGYRYEWIWYGVANTNGVSFQVPYNSIYYLFPCGSWNYEPGYTTTGNTATNATIYPGSTINLSTAVSNTGTVTGLNHANRIMPNTATASRVTVASNPHNGSVSGANITWNGLGVIGGNRQGATRQVVYRVNNNTPAGTQLCFRTDAYPDSSTATGAWDTTGTNNNRCFTVSAPPSWNYQAQTPTSTVSDSATGPKPGTVLPLSSIVRNTGNGVGPTNRHAIQVATNPAGPWSDTGGRVVTGRPAIAANSNSTPITHNYTIPANAAHNSQVCFRTTVSPVAGASAPTVTITNSGTHASGPLCFTIYDLRFNMENPVIGPGPTTRFVSPGDSVSPTISVENSGNGPTPPAASANRVRIEYSSNVHSPGSPNLSSTNTPAPIPAGGNHSFSGSGTIPTSAVVGSQYCVSARALPQQGYSDGTGTSGVTATTQFCYVVTNAPYFKVYGNDSWAGFAFSNNTSCTPGRGLVAGANGNPDNVGASDEYAVFGMGNIDSFGSANSPLSHLMKFANTPTHGNYGANRCVANYFDLLDDNATSLPTGINSLNGQAGGQYMVTGNASNRTLNGLSNYNSQHTVLVNGDLIIGNNVTYANSYSRSDVPILIFVVRGNIFINPNVSQLDGIYIAIPNGANSGIIETCSIDSTIGDFDPLGAPAGGGGACDSPLEVNGTFIAQNIYFKRTGGGINEAASNSNLGRCDQNVQEGGGNDERCAAEIFRFSPESYLARPFFDIGQSQNELEILQLRDLPPVF